MSAYTLHHGDCLVILPTLEAQSVDAVICDPPYGTTACKWDSVIPFEPMWREIKRVLKPRGACVLFGSQPFTSALVMSNPGWFKYAWVWDKVQITNFLNARHQPLRVSEDVLVFAKGKTKYNPQTTRGEKYSYGRTVKPSENYGSYHRDIERDTTTRQPKNIITFSHGRFGSDQLHPTQKPLALLEYLVKTYTDAGDTVLDFTMGSGTTGHACVNLGRRFIGIERDAGYYAIAERRIADAADPLRHMGEVAA